MGMQFDFGARRAEAFYWLDRRARGRGIVTEALDLVVEWGLARRLTDPHPRDARTASWAARYEQRIVRRIPAASFSPAPAIDAAHLAIRPLSEQGAGSAGWYGTCG